MKIYYLSTYKLPDGERLVPQLPAENKPDKLTRRISFTYSINQYLVLIAQDSCPVDKYFYVYSIDVTPDINFCYSSPIDNQTANLTKEIWVFSPVIPFFEGVIFVSKKLGYAIFDFNFINTPKMLSIDSNPTSQESLTEDTRTTLINKSRNVGAYKNQKYGKNRFERKKYSKIANSVKAYNQIDMNDFFKRDILVIKIPVQGETDNYIVSIKLEGVCAEIAKNIKSNNNKFEFRTVIQALTKIFNIGNVFVNCTCPDYQYTYTYWNIVNNVSTEDSAHNPGPGKGIRNNTDDKGRGCKHVLLVLSNQDFLMKTASVIVNYINYTAEHMKPAFNKLIFPKLYDTTIEEVSERGLVPEDTNLETTKNIIDTINDWAKNRGKYKPGTNKNPVTGTGGRTSANKTA